MTTNTPIVPCESNWVPDCSDQKQTTGKVISFLALTKLHKAFQVQFLTILDTVIMVVRQINGMPEHVPGST